MSRSKLYDIILLGATGFTGRIIASYLNRHDDSPSWAMAGRSKQRLLSIRHELGIDVSVDLIEAHTESPDSLYSMAALTRCVISAVGPYSRSGAEKVVDACVRAKTHYVDLSGETSFTESIVKRFHERAQQSNVAIVPSAGIDSLASDICTFLAIQHLKRIHGCSGAEEVRVVLRIPLTSVSSGTIRTSLHIAEDDPQQFKFVDTGRIATRKPWKSMAFSTSVWLPHYQLYGASSLLSPHNIRTVYRSWSLLEDIGDQAAYGAQFTFDSLVLGGNWLVNHAQVFLLGIYSFLILYVPLVRFLIQIVLPSNYGPDINRLREMTTHVSALARCDNHHALCTMEAQGDPGHHAAARMISETALLLSVNFERASILVKQGGVLTPATVGAEAIADRLKEFAGFRISTKTFSMTESQLS